MSQRLAYAILPLALTLTACASGFQESPHYSTVTKHLDVGGDLLLYADVDGDLAAGADYLDKLLERLRTSYPDLKLERIGTKRLLRQLGLDQVLAVGLSSGRDGKVFHNKAFFEYGKERRGLLLLAGTAPRELEVVRQAPEDADLVFESDLKIKSLLNLVEAIAVDLGGKDGKELLSGLDEKLPGTSLSLRQLVGHLDTRLVGVLRVDEQRSFVWPGDGKTRVPGIDLLVAADDLAVLFDAYQDMLRVVPDVKTSSEGGIDWVEFDPNVAGAPWLKPVLAKDGKSGRLFLATSKGFVREFLGEKPSGKRALAQAADFKRATGRFAAEANALTYMSGAFLGKVARFVRPLAKDDKQAQAGVDIIFELLPAPGIPFAAQQVNLPDGLYYTSYATASHKSTLFPALVAGPVVAGTAAAIGLASYHRLARSFSAAKPSVEAIPQGQAENDGADDDQFEVGPAGVDCLRIPLGGPSRGASKPTVNIVEFADFQCPFSARAVETLRKLVEQYPDDVRIHFRHHPLAFHTDAALAAQAAMAAEVQGKFWPMHDQLFANQKKLSRAALESYARAIGLDLPRFKTALEQHTYQQAVDDDVAAAGKLGDSGTPAFFINGRRLTGAQPFETFKKIVDEEIATAQRLMVSGTRRQDLYVKLMATAHDAPPVKPERPEAPPALSADVYKIPVAGAPARGGSAPKVTIVEFAEFQCPYCSRVRATLDELAKVYGKDLRLVFKHNPLAFHTRALPAALAAEAAREQGKFWPMHDQLFANQQKLDDADLERYARELGLEMAKYRAAVHKSGALRRRIEADQAEATRFGALGVPAFFVNGRPLHGAQPIETFKQLIDEEIVKANAKLRQGKPRKNLYAELTKGGLERAPKAKP